MGYRTRGSMAVLISAVPRRRQMERIKVHFSLGVIIGDNDGCGWGFHHNSNDFTTRAWDINQTRCLTMSSASGGSPHLLRYAANILLHIKRKKETTRKKYGVIQKENNHLNDIARQVWAWRVLFAMSTPFYCIIIVNIIDLNFYILFPPAMKEIWYKNWYKKKVALLQSYCGVSSPFQSQCGMATQPPLRGECWKGFYAHHWLWPSLRLLYICHTYQQTQDSEGYCRLLRNSTYPEAVQYLNSDAQALVVVEQVLANKHFKK